MTLVRRWEERLLPKKGDLSKTVAVTTSVANRIRQSWLASAIIALVLAVAPVAADSTVTRDAAIRLLTTARFRSDDYRLLQDFVASDPDMVYTVLADIWRAIPEFVVRDTILDLLVNGTRSREESSPRRLAPYRPNPHLADILALALDDPSPKLRKLSGQCLTAIAFREITTAQQYRQWRRTVGAHSIYEVMNTNCHEALKSLRLASGERKAAILRRLLRAPFNSSAFIDHTGASMWDMRPSGLAVYSRCVAEAAGAVESVAPCLKPDNPPAVRRLAVRILAEFPLAEHIPMESVPDLQREAPGIIAELDAGEIYNLLGPFKARWVTDLLIEHLQQGDVRLSDKPWVIGKLVQSGDPRAVPCLIGFFDMVEEPDRFGVQETLERGLAPFTKIPYRPDGERNGDWWREWWRRHKREFPLEARSMPIPNLCRSGAHARFALQPHVEYRDLAGNDGYWLISSGLAALSEWRPAGLVVVIAEDANAEERAREWQEAAGQAWNGKYLVAYVARPVLKPVGPTEVPARESVPEVVAEVVKDAQARTSIDPRRVFLYGEGDAGLDVYACSLKKCTPFRGFLLVSSPFRSSRLPSLVTAKGRRYYMLHNRHDKIAPYFLAVAAESILRKHGASVSLATLESDGTFRENSSAMASALRQGIQWLETAH